MCALSFLCTVRLCLMCDGCFLRADDLIQEVAWGSAITEVEDDQKKKKTPTHLWANTNSRLSLRARWVDSCGRIGKGWPAV